VESGDEESKYAPPEDGSEGTVNLVEDAAAPDNPLDKLKPVQKVSSPFDLPILPTAKALLVKKGKKSNQVHDGDDDSIILLTDNEVKEGTPLKSQKKEGIGNQVAPAWKRQ
jgi:hypothetical protein